MAENKEKKKESQATEEVSGMAPKKEKKAAWTLEKTKRAAKRFDTEEAWRMGAPASWKAADAKGWLAECTAHMTPKTRSMKKSA